MIAGYFHQGSGLGNQLHRYVATRVRAADLDVDFGMIYNPDGSGKEKGFKGKSFMDIDMGIPVNIDDVKDFVEKKVVDNGVDIRGYDPEFNFIQDGTVIEGEFQDERYWAHREKEVKSWLEVEPIEIPDDVCLIGFRGGEYAVYPDLFLTQDYWEKAIDIMRQQGISKFEVHTDDITCAVGNLSDLLPYNTKYIHDIGINWRSMRYAEHAIIANSSFYILPRWLNAGFTIAPRYWSRHNKGVWSMPQNYYSRFTYV